MYHDSFVPHIMSHFTLHPNCHDRRERTQKHSRTSPYLFELTNSRPYMHPPHHITYTPITCTSHYITSRHFTRQLHPEAHITPHAHHITSLHVSSHDSYTHTATPISPYHITTHHTTSHHMVSYMHTSTSQLSRWARTRSKRSPDPSKLSLSPLPSHIHPSHTHP